MKRRISRLCVFLLFGAIVNVAVAWGCVIWLPKPHTYTQLVDDADELRRAWDRFKGEQWGDMFEMRGTPMRLRGIGYVQVGVLGRDSAPAPGPYFALITEAGAGLPFHALRGGGRRDTEGRTQVVWAFTLASDLPGQSRPSEFIPLKPMWPGFAFNSIFYATMLWLLFAGAGFAQRRLRTMRGCCPSCAYPVGINSVCTECGTPVAWP